MTAIEKVIYLIERDHGEDDFASAASAELAELRRDRSVLDTLLNQLSDIAGDVSEKMGADVLAPLIHQADRARKEATP